MNFIKNLPPKYILLSITILGFLLRVNNLTIGFPMLYVSNDEAIYHQSALNMLANKTPFTLGNYGPLGSYVQIPFILLAFGVLFLTGKVNSVSDLELLLITKEGYLLFVPRVISAMFGTLSIIATYHLAKELFASRKIALWSGLFFAISFNMVHISHLARAWSGAIFFILLSAFNSIRVTELPANFWSFDELLNYLRSRLASTRVLAVLFLSDFPILILAFTFFFKKTVYLKFSIAFAIFFLFNLLLVVAIFPPFLRYLLAATTFLPIFAGFVFTKLWIRSGGEVSW